MIAPPRGWEPLWRAWVGLSPAQSTALWQALPATVKSRLAYRLARVCTRRWGFPAHDQAVQQCLDGMPARGLVGALEAAVARRELPRDAANPLEDALLQAVDKRGAWL